MSGIRGPNGRNDLVATSGYERDKGHHPHPPRPPPPCGDEQISAGAGNDSLGYWKLCCHTHVNPSPSLPDCQSPSSLFIRCYQRRPVISSTHMHAVPTEDEWNQSPPKSSCRYQNYKRPVKILTNSRAPLPLPWMVLWISTQQTPGQCCKCLYFCLLSNGLWIVQLKLFSTLRNSASDYKMEIGGTSRKLVLKTCTWAT